jgi:hypothetical protein
MVTEPLPRRRVGDGHAGRLAASRAASSPSPKTRRRTVPGRVLPCAHGVLRAAVPVRLHQLPGRSVEGVHREPRPRARLGSAPSRGRRPSPKRRRRPPAPPAPAPTPKAERGAAQGGPPEPAARPERAPERTVEPPPPRTAEVRAAPGRRSIPRSSCCRSAPRRRAPRSRRRPRRGRSSATLPPPPPVTPPAAPTAPRARLPEPPRIATPPAAPAPRAGARRPARPLRDRAPSPDPAWSPHRRRHAPVRQHAVDANDFPFTVPQLAPSRRSDGGAPPGDRRRPS